MIDPRRLDIDPCAVQKDLIVCRFFFFVFSRAAPAAYGGSQARGRIRAEATGLHQSHSNVGCKPNLQPTPQLTATLDP